jgi:ADP-ribosyl-[dinitrogen reductase] hydrolase
MGGGTMDAELGDRFRGCLLGLAVGDALGGPLELMSAEEIRAKYGGQVREMVGGGWLHLAPGEYTDDTQLMLCVGESIAARGTFDAEDVIRRFMAWYDGNPKDVGGITDSALSRMKRGVSWRDATYAAHLEHKGASAGNGAAMRSVPIALLRVHDPTMMMIESRESARLTHWNDLSAHGASALNLAIAALLLGSSLETAFAAVRKFVSRASPEVVRTIDQAHDGRAQLSTTGYVLDTLTIAWHALIHTADFESAVVLAVNLGGDADTQGALAGALAGARYGAAAIPERWLAALQHRGHIEGLAQRILAIASKQRRPLY